MDKLVKLFGVAIVLAIGIQAALMGGAWMDDKAFEQVVLQNLGDNMTAKQMETDIRTRAAQSKVPLKPTDEVKVVIDCGDGASRAPTMVTSRLGSAISVNKSCTVTGTAKYTRKVGLMKKPVSISQSKRFAATAQINVPGSSSGVQMPNNVPREVPADPRLTVPD